MLAPILLVTLLFRSLAEATPVPPDLPTPNPLQAKVHEKLAGPKQWYDEVPVELANEGLAVPVAATVDEPQVQPTEIVMGKMDWNSGATERFKDYLAGIKKKQQTTRQQEPMVPEQPRGGGPQEPRWGGEPQVPGAVNWGRSKRSVIPKKAKGKEMEEKEEEVPEKVEELDVDEVEQVELTNEDFDEMFRHYSEKHDNKGFEGMQGHLDGMMTRGPMDWREKVWAPQNGPTPGTQFRRDLNSVGSSPRYSSTPEGFMTGTDPKPAISINPEIFNRIAADYQFDKNPAAINNEDSYFGRSSSAPQTNNNNFGQTTNSKGPGRGKEFSSDML